MPEGLQTGNNDPGLIDASLRVLNDYTDELYDQIWLVPGAGIGTKGSTVTPTEDAPASPTAGFAAETFLDGNDSRYYWNIGTRANWRHHYCDATFWWTSTSSSTNNFRIQLLLSTLQEGTPTNTFPLNSTASYAGPAAAGTIMKSTVQGQLATFSIQKDVLLNFLFRRIGADAADTNTGTLILYMVRLKFYRA